MKKEYVKPQIECFDLQSESLLQVKSSVSVRTNEYFDTDSEDYVPQ